jgi:hypothetical protein
MPSPDELIQTATRKLPVFKYVIGGAALLALASVVIKWGVNLPTLLLVAGVLLVGAVAFIALQWLSKLKAEKANAMGLFLGWSLLGLLVAALLVTFTSAVFDQPWSLRSLIERQIGPVATTNKNDPPKIEPTPAPSPTPAGLFVGRILYQPQDITLKEYVLENPADATDADKNLLRLTAVKMGDITGKGLGLEISFTFANTSNAPMILDAGRQYFRLATDLGREAELVDFQAPPPESIVGPGQERTIRLLFATPGWTGKQSPANEIYLEVNGFKPILRAAWKLRLYRAKA